MCQGIIGPVEIPQGGYEQCNTEFASFHSRNGYTMPDPVVLPSPDFREGRVYSFGNKCQNEKKNTGYCNKFFYISTHLTSQSGGTSPNTWVSQAWRVDRSAELLLLLRSAELLLTRLMVDSGQAVCNNKGRGDSILKLSTIPQRTHSRLLWLQWTGL